MLRLSSHCCVLAFSKGATALFSLLLALVVTDLQNVANAVAIDNDVTGDPVIDCLEDKIDFKVNTRRLFAGRIYAKGRANESACAQSNYASQKTQQPQFSVPLGICGMKSVRSAEPRGMFYGVTVVVSFHPLYITKVDKAFHVKCFFEEAQRGVTAELGISMIPTTEATVSHNAAGCTYSIHRGSLQQVDQGQLGSPITYAQVGDKILHKWECADPMFGILLKNCYVSDGTGQKADVINDRGCPLDPILITGIRYSSDLTQAYAESHVFKFADTPGVWFFCQVQMCMKSVGLCEGITPPKCSATDSTQGISSGPYATTREPPASPPLPPSPQPMNPYQTTGGDEQHIGSSRPAASPAIEPSPTPDYNGADYEPDDGDQLHEQPQFRQQQKSAAVERNIFQAPSLMAMPPSMVNIGLVYENNDMNTGVLVDSRSSQPREGFGAASFSASARAATPTNIPLHAQRSASRTRLRSEVVSDPPRRQFSPPTQSRIFRDQPIEPPLIVGKSLERMVSPDISPFGKTLKANNGSIASRSYSVTQKSSGLVSTSSVTRLPLSSELSGQLIIYDIDEDPPTIQSMRQIVRNKKTLLSDDFNDSGKHSDDLFDTGDNGNYVADIQSDSKSNRASLACVLSPQSFIVLLSSFCGIICLQLLVIMALCLRSRSRPLESALERTNRYASYDR